jgi:hydrogenase/urease accessory protein HupE
MRTLSLLFAFLPFLASAHGQHAETESVFAHGFLHAVLSLQGLGLALLVGFAAYLIFKK